jgi:hypothetical protein
MVTAMIDGCAKSHRDGKLVFWLGAALEISPLENKKLLGSTYPKK